MAESAKNAVERLLREQVDCFEKLEVLLLLYRNSDRVWTAEEVAGQIRISTRLAMEALEALRDGKLLHAEDSNGARFRYHPDAAAGASAIEHLARCYECNPIAIIKPLAQNAVNRIRTSAIRTFAQSFRVRRNGNGG